MRPFSVRFPHDPESGHRLVLAQAGRAFLVGRAPHDPPEWAEGIWFEFGDQHGAAIALFFTNDDEPWASNFQRPEHSHDDEVIG